MCFIYINLFDFLVIPIKVKSESEVAQSCLTLCDPMTAAHQAPLSMRFSRQEHWSGLSCLPPGDLPDPGMEPMSLTSPALSGSIAIFPNIITPSSTRFDVKYFESLLEFVKDLCTFHQPSPFSKAMFLQ